MEKEVTRTLLQGELLTIYGSLPTVARKGFLEYPLPNRLNISFSYYSYLIVVMLSYIPSMYVWGKLLFVWVLFGVLYSFLRKRSEM